MFGLYNPKSHDHFCKRNSAQGMDKVEKVIAKTLAGVSSICLLAHKRKEGFFFLLHAKRRV